VLSEAEASLNKSLFKYSVLTAKKTLNFTITKIDWSMQFREIIAVYSEYHTKPINTLCGKNEELMIVKAGGTIGF
jgi:hypothetical protein